MWRPFSYGSSFCINCLCVYTIRRCQKNRRTRLEPPKCWILLLPACINLTHEAASAMLKRLRGGCSVYSELALYHPPNPSPTPFAHRHTLWVCEFKCVLCACLSALSLYVHAHREAFSLVCCSGFLSPPATVFIYTLACSDLLSATSICSIYKILRRATGNNVPRLDVFFFFKKPCTALLFIGCLANDL